MGATLSACLPYRPTARRLPRPQGHHRRRHDVRAEHGGNVIDLADTDHTDEAFFLRVEFELDGVDLGRNELGTAIEPIAERFAMRWALRFSTTGPASACWHRRRRTASTTCYRWRG